MEGECFAPGREGMGPIPVCVSYHNLRKVTMAQETENRVRSSKTVEKHLADWQHQMNISMEIREFFKYFLRIFVEINGTYSL